MGFNNLWDFFQGFDYIIKIFRILKVKSNIRTSLVTDFLRINNKLRTFQNSQVCQFLYALVYCSSTNITCPCNFQEWDSCIL